MNSPSIGSRVVASLVLSLGLIALGIQAAKSENKPAGKHEVTIDNFSFMPASLTVSAGTTVTWVNHDDVPHTVVNTGSQFKSKALDTDESFSYTFTDAGTYEYFCSLHPRMTATVIVENARK